MKRLHKELPSFNGGNYCIDKNNITNRKLTKEKRVKKKHQFVLILGIINVILPVIPVLSHRGWFGMVENGWKFIWVAAIMILLPFVSSLAGIIIGSIQLKKASTKPVKMGLLLSCTGLVMLSLIHI